MGNYRKENDMLQGTKENVERRERMGRNTQKKTKSHK